jgi:hypothetical protein
VSALARLAPDIAWLQAQCRQLEDPEQLSRWDGVVRYEKQGRCLRSGNRSTVCRADAPRRSVLNAGAPGSSGGTTMPPSVAGPEESFMITANTIPSVVNFEVLDAGHETAPRVPEASTLMAELRKAVIHASQWVSGPDPELARDRFLAEATDAADLERRSMAWERAQETRRALPPVL